MPSRRGGSREYRPLTQNAASPAATGDSSPSPTTPRAGAFSKPKMVDLEQGTAVYGNFPVELVDDLDFTTEDGHLTTEFWYTEEDLFYDEDDIESLEEGSRSRSRSRPRAKYARLVTASSHQQQLGKVIIGAGVTAAALASQLNCASGLLAAEHLWDSQWEWRDVPLVAMPCLLFVKLCLWFVVVFVQAGRRLNSDPGDLVITEALFDQLVSRICLAALIIVGVPRTLVELPTLLHVRKPSQPIAVFKAKDKRAYIIGWETKAHCDAEDLSQQFGAHAAGALFDVPLSLALLFVSMEQTGWNFAKVNAVVMSCCSAAWHTYICTKIWVSRRAFYAWLTLHTTSEAVKSARLAMERGDRALIVKVFTCHRLLKEYFGQAVPLDIKQDAEKVKYKL